jgi:hypothetical protein
MSVSIWWHVGEWEPSYLVSSLFEGFISTVEAQCVGWMNWRGVLARNQHLVTVSLGFQTYDGICECQNE